MKIYFITATDTDAGKTITSAALMKQYRWAHYWKPVQTGADRDSEVVRTLSGRDANFFHPGLTFSQPLSPHRAAELDGKQILLEDLDSAFQKVVDSVNSFDSRESTIAPGPDDQSASGPGFDDSGSAVQSARTPADPAAGRKEESILFIEGAGGLMVPLNRSSLWPDWLAEKPLSLILVCRTGLGTINHSLLSIEAIRQRNLDLTGLVFFGPENPDNQKTIAEFSGVPVLGQLSLGAALESESGSGLDVQQDPVLPDTLDYKQILQG